jgi:arylsulfatase A-like enzyme
VTDAASDGHPNVLLVVLDTVRAAETVPADPELTPTLAGLADEGAEFTEAVSTAPWTLPSHASLFTGTYPSKHGGHADRRRLDANQPTLASSLAEGGYETFGVSNNVWVTEEFGFTRGFETFEEFGERDGSRAAPTEAGGDSAASGPTDDGAERTVERVRSWLDDRDGDRPFFAFCNFIEPHLEYRPPESIAESTLPDGWSYDEAMTLRQDPRAFDADQFDHDDEAWEVLRALYRAEMTYLDSQLERLVDVLRAADEWEDTVTIVVGDHGENVGEHGLLGHQYSLYDTVVRVPFVCHGGPFADDVPDTDEPVQPVDVAPTVRDVTGVTDATARRTEQGRSLHPDAATSPRDVAISEYRGPQPPIEVLESEYGPVPDRIGTFQRSLRAVRTPNWKYVRGSDGTERLYDLAADPGERHDVSDESPAETAALADRLDRWLDSFEHGGTAESVSVEESTKERLSDLGYL